MMTICPSHRSKLGIGWSSGSTIKCGVPQSMSGHGGGKDKKWPNGKARICYDFQRDWHIYSSWFRYVQIIVSLYTVQRAFSIKLESNVLLRITGVRINCKKKMSEKEDKSEAARTAALELSTMQLVCTWR